MENSRDCMLIEVASGHRVYLSILVSIYFSICHFSSNLFFLRTQDRHLMSLQNHQSFHAQVIKQGFPLKPQPANNRRQLGHVFHRRETSWTRDAPYAVR